MNIKGKLIYMAAPFTHDNYYIEKERVLSVGSACHILLLEGAYPISPVCHWAPIRDTGLKIPYKEILELGLKILSTCDMMFVLQLNGWQESEGVRGEIEFARKNGIEIRFFKSSEFISLFNKVEM